MESSRVSTPLTTLTFTAVPWSTVHLNLQIPEASMRSKCSIVQLPSLSTELSFTRKQGVPGSCSILFFPCGLPFCFCFLLPLGPHQKATERKEIGEMNKERHSVCFVPTFATFPPSPLLTQDPSVMSHPRALPPTSSAVYDRA